jgi:hypothetical protein
MFPGRALSAVASRAFGALTSLAYLSLAYLSLAYLSLGYLSLAYLSLAYLVYSSFHPRATFAPVMVR